MTREALVSLDESSYYSRLARSGSLALVLFSSPTCGTCRVVERRLPDIAPPGVRLFKVDVQRTTALAHAFEVFHLPTLLLYRAGHFHARLECEITAPALQDALAKALIRPAQEEP
jgi:thioredoxin-like negative regulator of GroEL